MDYLLSLDCVYEAKLPPRTVERKDEDLEFVDPTEEEVYVVCRAWFDEKYLLN